MSSQPILTAQMYDAYDKHRPRAESIGRQYALYLNSDDLDDFNLEVQNSFLHGVNNATLMAVHQALTEKKLKQQQIADLLGLKDRSSISKMLKSGLIDGIRLTAALYRLPELKDILPTQQQAALHGFAWAAAFIKARVRRNPKIEGTMLPQDASYVIGMLADAEWGSAARDDDLGVLRRIAARIVQERAIRENTPATTDNRRPEQYVLMLQGLWVEWADFMVLALWAIPEYIPADEGERRTL